MLSLFTKKFKGYNKGAVNRLGRPSSSSDEGLIHKVDMHYRKLHHAIVHPPGSGYGSGGSGEPKCSGCNPGDPGNYTSADACLEDVRKMCKIESEPRADGFKPHSDRVCAALGGAWAGQEDPDYGYESD